MDCRDRCQRLAAGGQLRPTFLFPLLGAFSLLGGCISAPPAPNSNPPVAKPNAPPVAQATVTEKDLPKRTPQAATCVAFGNLQLETAKEGTRPPAQCQELYDMARKYYQQAIKTDPKCADAYRGLAAAYEGLGDSARTVETYQKAQKAFPKDGSFYFDL